MNNRLTFILLFSFFFSSVYSQSPVGHWNGAIEVGNIKLRLVFHINEVDGKLISTMDSPDQGATGLTVDECNFENGKLTLKMLRLKAEFNGSFSKTNADLIIGVFSQAGQSFALNLERGEVLINRPQEPIPPYPYYSEEVMFKNTEDNVSLAGTLTKPKKRGKYNTIILVSGSGPQNRNEELLGHKPFLVIADYLTKEGYAVLRYDDRGVGASTGNFSTGTTYAFARDANAAVEFLSQRKDVKQITIMGHSEGGLIAPMVAVKNTKVDNIILLAGPGMKSKDLLLMQQELIGKSSGMTENELRINHNLNLGALTIMVETTDHSTCISQLQNYFDSCFKALPDSFNSNGLSDEETVKMVMAQYSSVWMFEFVKIDPSVYLKQVTVPTLALFGEKDLQVPAQPNLDAMEKAVNEAGQNSELTTKILLDLNHLFQESETGAISEYSEIEQTFSPNALQLIKQWLNER